MFSLDGTGSSDSDNEPLGYAWTVLSGAGSLRLASTATPTLTITGPTPEYGTTVTETVAVEVLVTDCFGDISTDTVTFVYGCTGE